MNQRQDGIQAIDALVKIEETMAEIYRLFAKRFPANRDLWSRLAEEEVDHAGWIRDLYGRVEEGTVFLSEEGFRLEGIQRFLRYAEDQLKEAQREKLPFLRALDMALDLESALLERKFYKMFEADSEALAQAFEDMDRQIQEHTRRIGKALAHEQDLS